MFFKLLFWDACLFCSDVGEALVSKGYATVVRYRQDDDQRSSHYDELLAAEARANKKGVGLHSRKDSPSHRVADISGVCIYYKKCFSNTPVSC